MRLNSLPVSEFSGSYYHDALYSLMFPDRRPALNAAVRWLTASWIVLSTHGFWFENVLNENVLNAVEWKNAFCVIQLEVYLLESIYSPRARLLSFGIKCGAATVGHLRTKQIIKACSSLKISWISFYFQCHTRHKIWQMQQLVLPWKC